MKRIVICTYLVVFLAFLGSIEGKKVEHDIEEPEGGLSRQRPGLGYLFEEKQ